MRTILLAFLMSSAALGQSIPATHGDSEFQFRFTQVRGANEVGLKVIQQYDSSRGFLTQGSAEGAPATESRRPLQTLIWYPAESSANPAMTVGDYATLNQSETNFDKPTSQGKSQSFVADFTHGTTSLRTWAIRDAPLRVGRFPLVIYAPSINAPSIENIELCEYLASNGFVIIATPSMGAKSRNMTMDIAGASAGAQDISFLIDFAKSLPDADTSRIAAIGYSWG